MTDVKNEVPTEKEPAPADPLAGREITLLNNLLAALIPDAQQGDRVAIEHVLKVLELKRKYVEDLMKPATKWRL